MLRKFNKTAKLLCARYDYEVKYIKHAAFVDVFENLPQQDLSETDPSITLCLLTHLTMSRFQMLKNIAANWKGITI